MNRSSPSPVQRLRIFITPGGVFAAALVLLAGCVHSVIRPEQSARIDATIADAIAAKKTAGGVVWIERDGKTYTKAFGQRVLVPTPEPAAPDTIYDVASLTKVLATTTAVMQLVERGKLELDAPVARYLPAFAQNEKSAVTLRHLLTHTSGLRAGLDPTPAWRGVEAAIAQAVQEKLRHVPGSTFLYSDINFILLGELVRIASGQRLDAYAQAEIFAPLKMLDTSFLPPAAKIGRIAPTELVNGTMLHGVVHDPTSRMMGGVAGHAGVFSTAADVARFSRMLLNGGELEGRRILSAQSVAEMTRIQNDGSDRRGLGWDIDSRYSGPRGRWFPAGRSFGHTGWTGTSMWLVPETRTFVIFMGNRVHPDGKGDVTPMRRALGTIAAEALRQDGTAVLNGIDVLVRQNFAPLQGLRIGLITNHSGRDRDARATIDLLHTAPGVKLVALFSPEHGIRGVADDKVGDTVDEKTKLPVYSLYGESPRRAPNQSAADYDRVVIGSRAPKPEQLRDIDALVFDIQDIGARYFTYPATLGAALEVAAREKKKFFVLDRVNPITGQHVEGPVMSRHDTFAGYHAVPIRHGMTLGELARMYNAERKLGADLTVIACERWDRSQWLDQAGLSWINPSPSMRSLTAATLYPALCLIESTSVSMGRGTLKPFEQIGAPYIDGPRLAAEMNAAGLAGVRFEPVKFTPVPELYPGPPATLKHNGQECSGVRVVLTDREACNTVDVGFALALALHRLHPEQFKVAEILRLMGDEETLKAMQAGQSLAQIKAGWSKRLAEFETRRVPFLLYR